MNRIVKLNKGLQDGYQNIPEKDVDSIYYTTDEKHLFFGEDEIGYTA